MICIAAQQRSAMKITKLEEYGLRCLLRVAGAGDRASVTIPEVAEAENISLDYAAKLLTTLRRLKLVKSIRGAKGGYSLARPAEQITLGETLKALGGLGFGQNPCKSSFPGVMASCPHKKECGIRPIWFTIARYVSAALDQLTLADLVKRESTIKKLVDEKFQKQIRSFGP